MVRWLLGNFLRMRTWLWGMGLLAAMVLLAAVLLYCEYRSRTPLMWAAGQGDLSDVQVLVEEGAPLDATTTWGSTALHFAAQDGYLEVVKYLVGAGADMEATTTWGSTALHSAAQEGRLEVVKFLVEQGADVNARDRGWTALYWAAWKGRLEVVKYLVEQGASLDATDNHGDTVRDAALRSGHTEIAEYLESVGG